MKNKTIFTYLLTYFFLNVIGIFCATQVWWTDGLNLSFLKKETLVLLFSAGIVWIGIIYLTILLIRTYIVKFDNQNFLGPLDLALNEFLKDKIGENLAVKFKNSMNIAFPIFILTIIIFINSMNFWEKYQLNKYGKEEIVIVKDIRKNKKGFPYIYFQYNNQKSATLLENSFKNLKIGDKFVIKYSSKNPKIIKYKEE